MTTEAPPPAYRGLVMLDAEPVSSAPIGGDWKPAALTGPAPRGAGWGVLALGVVVLLASWLAVSAVVLVDDLFSRSLVLGVLACAGFALGAGLIFWALLREARAWRRLARVDLLRQHLGGPALGEARAAAAEWVAGLSAIDAAPVLEAIAAAGSPEAVRAVLRARVSAVLTARAGEIGRKAALEGAAVVAILPHAALDALFAGLRGLRAIREVAELYGLRPASLSSLALARRAAWAAATTAGAEIVAQSVTDQVLGNAPVIKHVAGGAVAGLRLYRLARAAALACDPLTPTP